MRAAAIAPVGQPTAPPPQHGGGTSNVQRVRGVARDHLRNAAMRSSDHPSIKTSINPVDNSPCKRESPATSGLSWGSDQMNGGGDGIRTHGLYIANVEIS